MRHLKTGRALGVKPAHRRAMLRNLVTSVLEHEQITTTAARAKELRRPLDKMITLGKRGDLNARRQALTFVKSKKAMAALFGELAERYAERPGGFARLIRVGLRKGDGAELVRVQLVGAPNDPFAAAEKPKARRGRGRKAAEEKAPRRGRKKQEEAEATEAAAEAVTEEAPKKPRRRGRKAAEAETAAEAQAPETKDAAPEEQAAEAAAPPEPEPEAPAEPAEEAPEKAAQADMPEETPAAEEASAEEPAEDEKPK